MGGEQSLYASRTRHCLDSMKDSFVIYIYPGRHLWCIFREKLDLMTIIQFFWTLKISTYLNTCIKALLMRINIYFFNLVGLCRCTQLSVLTWNIYVSKLRMLVSIILCNTPPLPESRTPVSIILHSIPPPPLHRPFRYSVSVWPSFLTWDLYVSVWFERHLPSKEFLLPNQSIPRYIFQIPFRYTGISGPSGIRSMAYHSFLI